MQKRTVASGNQFLIGYNLGIFAVFWRLRRAKISVKYVVMRNRIWRILDECDWPPPYFELDLVGRGVQWLWFTLIESASSLASLRASGFSENRCRPFKFSKTCEQFIFTHGMPLNSLFESFSTRGGLRPGRARDRGAKSKLSRPDDRKIMKDR